MAQHDLCTEPSSPETLLLQVPARPESVSAARAALDGLRLERDFTDVAKLLLTELVTNSIRHAGLSRSDRIRVTVIRSGRSLRVSVDDRKPGTVTPVVVGAIRPSPGAYSGWGLYLIDRLATRWGVDQGHGYWFELDEPASAAEGGD